MLHPHTLPVAAGQCYSYIIAADRTDGQRDMRRAWWGVCGRGRDGQTRGQPSMRRCSLIAGVRLHTKTTLLQYYEQFHTTGITK